MKSPWGELSGFSRSGGARGAGGAYGSYRRSLGGEGRTSLRDAGLFKKNVDRFWHAHTLGMVLNRGCASQVFDRGAETAARGAALPTACPQRQGNPRGDVPLMRWSRWA
jgi:hypothetical protein